MALDYIPSPGWAVIYGETPSATRWSELGDNDDALATGAGLDDDSIDSRHYASASVDDIHLSTNALFLGKTNVITTQTPGTTGLDVASVTVTVPSTSRQIECHFDAPQITTGTPASDRFMGEMYEDSTVIQRYYFGAPPQGIPLHFSFKKAAPAAGSHTYKMRIIKDQGTGSGTMYADTAGAAESSIQIAVTLV